MRYTENEIERVARVAFKLPQRRMKKLASVDKANVLETSRYWRRWSPASPAEFPEVIAGARAGGLLRHERHHLAHAL